jgi:hypothetical protein
MSERLQIRKSNKSTGSPSSSNQSKLLNKNEKHLMLHPPFFQAKLAISEPGDKYEQEADRIAEAVINSGHDANGNPISFTTLPLIQRQGKPEAEHSGDEKIKKSAEKTGEAFLKTSLGQEIKGKALKLGLDFVNTLPGKVITGAAAVSTVSYLAATNSQLPMQLPEIPLDVITPGLKVKLTYEGPVRNPTAASITFVFEEKVKSEEKKAMTETEKLRAENARIAADQERFREGLKSPEQRAKEKAQFERAFWEGRDPLGLRPLNIPGIKREDELLQRKVADNSATDSFVPPIVHEVLNSPGQPLDPATRAYMEPRFGYDFSHVRVHTDNCAAVIARSLNARAFTIGRDIMFGSGQYVLGTNEGKRLLAHELTHTIQQRAGVTGLTVQRDVIDDVREKLSYGLFDWVITDAEAMEALALLGTIPTAALGNELSRLGSKYITRLFDNLPDAAKTGEIYQRVVQALGSAGVVPYARNLLSYGLFDWVITDAEVTRIFNTFINLQAAAREQFLMDLDAAGRLDRLISNANTGHHALYIRPWIATLTRGVLNQQQRRILRTIVRETTKDAIETLKLATETRFNVTVGGTTIPRQNPVEWDPSLMRQAYLILEELPEAHVARNKELLRLGQFREVAASGGIMTGGLYSPQEVALNIEISDVRTTLIHEVGHAVDEEMGWSSGPEPAKPTRGGWKTYYRGTAGYRNCAQEMVDDSGGAIKTALTLVQRQGVINEMATSMINRSVRDLESNIRKLAWFGGLAAARQRTVLADRTFDALRIGLRTPWFNARNGGEHLGDHVYQESYENRWVRYRHEARSRKVSLYQFRDPGEWFAEAYEFYYRPDPRGRGAKLADKDPDTKKYFDTNVHTRAPSR